MPSDSNVEKATISCLLRDPRLMEEANLALTLEHFYCPSNQAIFREAQNMYAASGEIDFVLLSRQLQTEEGMTGRTLAELADDIPTTRAFPQYIDILSDKLRRRELIISAEELSRRAYDEAEPILGTMEEMARVAERGINESMREVEFTDWDTVLANVCDKIEASFKQPGGELPGIPTGFPKLDEWTNGMQEGQLWVIGGRPGNGKTTAGFQIVQDVVRNNIPAAVFSAEMIDEELAARVISSLTGIGGLELMRGDFPGAKLPLLAKALKSQKGLPLYIDDRENMSLFDIEAGAHQLVKKHGVKVIMVDYIQLLREDKDSRSREDAIRRISAGLKAIAKKYRITVIALSQLNRGDGGRPNLARLRDSGAIEQDANVILFIHNDDPEDAEPVTPVDFILAKCRGGRLGTIDMEFNKPVTTFQEPCSNF